MCPPFFQCSFCSVLGFGFTFWGFGFGSVPFSSQTLRATVVRHLAATAGAVLLDAGDGALGGTAAGAVAEGGRGAFGAACSPFFLPPPDLPCLPPLPPAPLPPLGAIALAAPGHRGSFRRCTPSHALLDSAREQ